MSCLIYIFFGVLPSIIWLLFYLRKDAHPEPKRMILKIFLYGMLATAPALLLELGIFQIIKLLPFNMPTILISLFYIFLGVALVEEMLKYLIVKGKVLNNPAFDEPLDIMLYMIIAALGFAAMENILTLLPIDSYFGFGKILSISFLRFVGAVFLHTLCSGTIGYFWALSIYEKRNRFRLLLTGISTAVILHGAFNFFIMNIEKSMIVKNGMSVIIDFGLFAFSVLSLIIILISLALFVFSGFRKLKKLKAVCKITH